MQAELELVVKNDEVVGGSLSETIKPTSFQLIAADEKDPSSSLVSLSWSNLSVWTKKSSKEAGAKCLLNSVSGTIEGGLWAIMGPSGSGKTTFLSTVSRRLDLFRMDASGEMKLNGLPYNKLQLKNISGYVMQDDLVFAHFTVAETLSYCAELRLDSSVSREERESRVLEVMQLMGLEHCKNTFVGDTRFKGISGGERKRLCIAMELLTRPSLLFLDEPTSGLDSTTALSVMRTLKNLSNRGNCTVVCTIHQPQSKIFHLFDNLILMKGGDFYYQGSAAGAISHFEQLGYPLPKLTNPADYLIDLLSDTIEVAAEGEGQGEGQGKDKDVEAGQGKVVVHLTPIGPANHPDVAVATKAVGDVTPVSVLTGKIPTKKWLPWYMQFFILLRRNLHGHLRRWDIIAMNIVVTMLISTFVCMSVWNHIGLHKAGSAKRLPALFFCVIHQGVVASLQGTHSFPLDRALMLRERAAGAYYVSAYFFAKCCADFMAQLIAPILFTCMVYPNIGFRPDVDKFFIFMGFMILTSTAATSLANMISCVFVSIEMSTVVLAALYEIIRLYGGWFISPALMSDYPRWRFADAISYVKYAFVGISLNENDFVLTCLPQERTPPFAPGPQTFANCKMPPLTKLPYDGHAYNAFYGYDQYTIGYCAGILVVYIVVCRVIAYLGLRFIKV